MILKESSISMSSPLLPMFMKFNENTNTINIIVSFFPKRVCCLHGVRSLNSVPALKPLPET